MHIVYLCSEYPPGRVGGVGVFTQTLGRAMARRGHRVTVVGTYRALRRMQIDQDQGVTVIRLPHLPIRGVGALVDAAQMRRVLSRLVTSQSGTVIEGQEGSFAFVGDGNVASKLIRMQGGHTYFSTTLGVRPKRWRAWLERRSFRNADALAAVSRFTAETTRALLRLGNRPIEIIPNPIDTTLFSPQQDIDEQEGLCVYAGTITEKKGVQQLILAMRQVIRAIPHARLWLIGRDSKDHRGRSTIAALQALIDPGLRAHIVFMGHTDHLALRNHLACAQVCVFPSHMETQGIVVGEAMALGKAVVTSRIGPIMEFVEDGLHGLLCDPHDPHSIAEAVIRLLTDAALRRQIGVQARARVLEALSIDVLADKNEAFYTRITKSR